MCQIHTCTLFNEVRNKHSGKAVPYFCRNDASQQEHSILIFLKAHISFTSSINVSSSGSQWMGYIINSLAEVFLKQLAHIYPNMTRILPQSSFEKWEITL
jgi:hypothetical protein